MPDMFWCSVPIAVANNDRSTREFLIVRRLRLLIDDCHIDLVRFSEILRGCPENRGISARLGFTFASLHRDSH